MSEKSCQTFTRNKLTIDCGMHDLGTELSQPKDSGENKE